MEEIIFLIKENHFKGLITFCFFRLTLEYSITKDAFSKAIFFHTAEIFRVQIEHRDCVQTRAAQRLLSLGRSAIVAPTMMETPYLRLMRAFEFLQIDRN